jgi:hypothetical protein
VCDLPDNPAAQATKFSPQRVQAVIGFVYTSTAANPAVGGFGLGDLASGPVSGPGFKSLAGLAPTAGAPATFAVPASPAAVGTALGGSSATGGAPATAARARPKSIAAVGPIGMGTATRVLLALVCVAAWGWLTHLGASHFRRATAPCPGDTE